METNSDFVSRLTGVAAPKKPAGSAAQGSSFTERLTGQTPDPSKFQKYETFDPISEGRKTINLSSVYTDSLESYTKYGVATNPFNDWNEQRAQNQSTWEKWQNGLTKAAITTVGSVYENTVGVVAGLGSLAFADSHSYYDNPVGRQVDAMNDWAREVMPNYYTQQEQNASVLAGLGTANFWADKFAGGLGYTLGALATAWIGVGELGVIGRAGSILGRGAKGVAVGEEIAAGTAALAEAGEASAIIADGAKLGSKQKTLWTTVKAAGESKDIGKGLESLDRAVRVRTATKRLVAGTNMSLAEASVEAREAKNQFIEEQKRKWDEEHPGEQMPTDVLEGVERSAYAAGNLTFGINLPILTVTNLIMFGKTLEGARVGEKAMFAIDRDVTKTAGEQWAISTGSTKIGQLYGKAQRNFGKPIESMLTEGFQEGSQFAASDMARSYYGEKFHDGAADMSQSLSTALSKTFGTKEGLENILIGALVGGGTGAVSRLAGAEKKLMKMKTSNTTEALSILNAGGTARALEVSEQNAENTYLVNQMTAAKDRNKKEGITAAEIAANDLEADKHRMRLIHNVFVRLHRLGATDYALDQFEDAASMSEDQFKEAFGYDKDRTIQEQTGGKSQLEVISDTKAKMELAIKRSEQVHNILAQYDPGRGLIQKIKDGMQSEQTKNNKLIEKSVRDLYGKMLTFQLLDIDTIDEHIEKQYNKLLELAPALNAYKPEEIKYRLKVGKVKIDENGKPSFSAVTDTKVEDKFNEVLQDIFTAKYALSPSSPVDAMEFQQTVRNLSGLIQDRTRLSESFNNLAGNPREMDLYVEAQELLKEAAQKKAADDRAVQAIEGSETADELRENISDDASPEVRAAAAERVEELEKKEQDFITQFEKLSDDELKAIDFDSLSAIEQAALLKVQQQRNEEARKTNGVKVSEQLEENNEGENVSFTTEELEAADNIISYGSGTKFLIDGKFYLTATGDPSEALVLSPEGNVIGVELVDTSTNNTIKWIIQDELDPSDPNNISAAANILKENAKSRMLQYSILIGMAEIRSEEEVTTLSTEENETVIDLEAEVIIDDINTIVENEELGKEELEARGVFDPTVDIAVTAGLSVEQIRAQVEIIEQDILELDNIINKAWKNAKSGGRNMSREQFRKQPKIQARFKQRLVAKKILESKIEALRAMKASQDNVKEVDGSLTPPETEFLINLVNQQIKRLEKIQNNFELQAAEYNKIIDGTYPDQNIEAAEAALLALNAKIERVKTQIKFKNNIINKVNEDAELKERPEDDNNTEGPGTATEGEELEGENLDSREGPATQGLDGSISAEEAERIRQEKLTAAKNKKTTKLGDGKTPKPKKKTVSATSDGKNLDVQITKGEVTTKNGKVVVQLDGSISTDIPVIKIDGKEVEMFPSMLTSPDVATIGSYVSFVVGDNTGWWKTQIPAEVADNPEAYKQWMETEGWKKVPIFVVNEEGLTLNILKAFDESSADGFKGSKRKEIVKYHNEGQVTGAKVSGKFFDTKSISNTVGPDGKPYFYPASDMFKNGDASILYVGNDVLTGEMHWRVAYAADENADVTASVTRTEKETPDGAVSTLTPGQIGIVTMNPSGQPIVIVASTKKMTVGGMTAALNHITKEEAEAYKFAQIVGCNMLEVNVESEEDEVSTEDTFIASELQPDNVNNFMMTYQAGDGQSIFVFYSQTAKSLVRINGEELKYALLGGEDARFGFIQDTQNEQGYTKFQSVTRDAVDFTNVAKEIAREFKEVTMNKRFQVDKNQLSLKEDKFVSPITGKQYIAEEGKPHPYIQYLSSTEEFSGEARTEGSGANSILAVDTRVNAQGSVFHDVNLNLGPLQIEGADIETEENLRADEIADTIDSNTETSKAPKFNGSPLEMQEAILAQIIKDQEKVKGRTPSTNEKGEDITSYYVIETGNTKNYKTVDSDKLDANGKPIQITGELLDRTTSKIPDNFDKSTAYLYANSRIAGTTSDKIVREYFENGSAVKPDGIEEEAFEDFVKILDKIKIQMEENGQEFLTNNFIFWDANAKVAGETDILVKNSDGSFSIYDTKTFTSKTWGNFSTRYEGSPLTKKEKYSMQLSIYSNMFQNMYNSKIKDIKIVPFILTYNEEGVISEVESRVIIDMPFSSAADEIVPPIPVKKTKAPAKAVTKAEPVIELAPGDQLIEYKGNKYVVNIDGTITNSKGKSINPTSPVGKKVLEQVDFDTLDESEIPAPPAQVSATPMADSETSIVGEEVDDDLFFDIEETEGEETGKKEVTFADITARFGQNDLPPGVTIDTLDEDPEASNPEASNSDTAAEALAKKQAEAKKKGEQTIKECKTTTKK